MIARLWRALRSLFPRRAPAPPRCPRILGSESQCALEEGHAGECGIDGRAMFRELMLEVERIRAKKSGGR